MSEFFGKWSNVNGSARAGGTRKKGILEYLQHDESQEYFSMPQLSREQMAGLSFAQKVEMFYDITDAARAKKKVNHLIIDCADMKGNKLTDKDAKALGYFLSNKYFKAHMVAFAYHTNKAAENTEYLETKGHAHLHLVIQNESLDTGKAMQMTPAQVDKMWRDINRFLAKRGVDKVFDLPVLEGRERWPKCFEFNKRTIGNNEIKMVKREACEWCKNNNIYYNKVQDAFGHKGITEFALAVQNSVKKAENYKENLYNRDWRRMTLQQLFELMRQQHLASVAEARQRKKMREVHEAQKAAEEAELEREKKKREAEQKQLVASIDAFDFTRAIEQMKSVETTEKSTFTIELEKMLKQQKTTQQRER